MRHKQNGGFTLMELMLVIAASSIVTLAATTLLLFGLRANSRTTDSIVQQNTSRTLMATLEKITMDARIGKVESDYGTWAVLAEDKTTVRFSYSPSSQTIYAGSPENGMAILENVLESEVTLDETRGLVTFSVTTEEGTYSSSVYCRTGLPEEDKDGAVDGVMDDLQDNTPSDDTVGTETNAARIEFLRVLANQYKIGGTKANNGLILNSDKQSTGQYYSEWYIGGYEDHPGWNANTPWCACFLSWGLNQVQSTVDSEPAGRSRVDYSGKTEYFWYASVDDYVKYFKSTGNSKETCYWIDNRDYSQVRPGDFIVFDWNLDNDPSHIGAVLLVDTAEGRVYTIEGNTSNRVGVRSYKLTDPRIMGYGVIDWSGSNS